MLSVPADENKMKPLMRDILGRDQIKTDLAGRALFNMFALYLIYILL